MRQNRHGDSRQGDRIVELDGDEVIVAETMDGERTVVLSDEFVCRPVAWGDRSSHDVVAEGDGVTRTARQVHTARATL